MRLARVQEDFGDQLSLTWRSFVLRPEASPRSMEKFRQYTTSWERPAALEPATKFQTWSGEHEPPSHSIPALAAGKVAATFGATTYQRFSMGVFEAYFTDNRTVSDREVLVELAVAAGIDAEEFTALLAEPAFEKQVWMDHLRASEHGVTAVPSVIVNEQWVLPGALEEQQYRRIVERALAQNE